MIRAVIFDFNGVLVDDEHVHFELFREILAQEGIALSEERYHEQYLGYDDRGCFEAALAEAKQDAGRPRIDALIARKAERYATVAETGLRFFPGAPESLAALADQWPLAICSGALRPEIEFALDRMRVRERVVAIVSAEDTTRCKPDPQGYLLALDALRGRPGTGLEDLAAAECLVIEDSLAGVASAKTAGMWTIAVSHTYNPEALVEAGANVVVPNLLSLNPAWVNRLFD